MIPERATRQRPKIKWRGLVESGRSFFFQGHEPSTFSDRISETGLLLLFPEFGKARLEIRDFIRFGITVDNLIDENPNAFINNLPIANIDRFNELRNRLNKEYSGHPELLKNISTYLHQLWSVENEARKSSVNENVDLEEYRELSNAIWTRMCIYFAKSVTNCSKTGEQQPKKKQFQNLLPTLEELSESVPPDINNLRNMYADLITGKDDAANTTSVRDPRERVLFLFLMSAANIYDHHGKDINRAINAPGLIERTSKYEEQLQEILGNNRLLLQTMFKVMDLLVAIRVRSRRNH